MLKLYINLEQGLKKGLLGVSPCKIEDDSKRLAAFTMDVNDNAVIYDFIYNIKKHFMVLILDQQWLPLISI